ncbi:MAG: hypothetical protein GY822_13625 [Deltaproteobacteria bacterium]|nr:hypothetical protein [Deltaproteobacteria bacterium]
MKPDGWTQNRLIGALLIATLFWVPMVMGEYGAWRAVSIMLTTGLFHLAATGIGERLLRLLRVPLGGPERWFFGAAFGWGILGQTLYLAALLDFYSSTTAWILVVIGLLLLGSSHRILRSDFRSFISNTTWRSPWWWVCVPSMALVALFVTLPPSFYDALVYHVGLPFQFAAHGGLVTSQHNMFTAMPLLGEMASSIPFLCTGDVETFGAAYFWLFISSIFAIAEVADRCLKKGSGPVVAAVFSSMPLVTFFSLGQKPDLLVGFFTLAILRGFTFLSRETNDDKPATEKKDDNTSGFSDISPRYTALYFSLLLGFGAATKTTFLPTAALFVLFFFALPKWRVFVLRHSLLFLPVVIGTSILVGCAVYIKNWVILGNPVYPFAQSLFPGPSWLAQTAGNLSQEAIRLRSLDDVLQLWRLPIDRSLVNSSTTNELPGGFLLLGAVFAFGFQRWPAALKTWLLLLGLSLPAWLMTHALLRYNSILWTVPPLLCGWAFFKVQEKLDRQKWLLVLPVVVLSLAHLLWSLAAAQSLLRRPLDMLSGTPRHEHLAKVMEPYAAYRWLNEHTPQKTLVFLATGDARVAYLKRPAVFSEVYTRPLIDVVITESKDAQEIIERLQSTNAQLLLLADGLEKKLQKAGWGKWTKDQIWQWEVAKQSFSTPVTTLEGYQIFRLPRGTLSNSDRARAHPAVQDENARERR